MGASLKLVVALSLLATIGRAERSDRSTRIRYLAAAHEAGWTLLVADRPFDIDLSADGQVVATITETGFDDALAVTPVRATGLGDPDPIGMNQAYVDRCAQLDRGSLDVAVLHYAPKPDGVVLKRTLRDSSGVLRSDLLSLDGSPDPSSCFDLSTDGSRLAYATSDGRVHLARRESKTAFRDDAIVEGRSPLFEPGGRALFRVDAGRTVRRDVSTGDERVLSGWAPAQLLAVSPDGGWVAVATSSGSLRILETASGASFATARSIDPALGARRAVLWARQAAAAPLRGVAVEAVP